METTKSAILLVEDDCLLLLNARIALEDAGYEVIEASNGAAALATFRVRDDIVAVISDVKMPGPLDGVDLASAIRALRPDMPILLTTGSGAMPAPPDGVPVIEKPYRSCALAAQIDALSGGVA